MILLLCNVAVVQHGQLSYISDIASVARSR